MKALASTTNKDVDKYYGARIMVDGATTSGRER